MFSSVVPYARIFSIVAITARRPKSLPKPSLPLEAIRGRSVRGCGASAIATDLLTVVALAVAERNLPALIFFFAVCRFDFQPMARLSRAFDIRRVVVFDDDALESARFRFGQQRDG